MAIGKKIDVRIPADPQDQQTTDARSALPPVEFTVTPGASSNLITIQDRQGPQARVSTVSYRVYFLPEAFAPKGSGTTTTIPDPVVYRSAIRASGRNVASLVADVKAPALGTPLTVNDTVNFGQKGYYYCVGVNRASVEAPVEHMVLIEGVAGAAATGGGGVAPLGTTVDGISGAVTLVAGTNIAITDNFPVAGDITIAATGGTGTVTSVDMTVPTELAVAGNPIVAAGTLALTWSTETANKVFAGPTSGGAATPTFRALVSADIPDLSVVYVLVSGNIGLILGLQNGWATP